MDKRSIAQRIEQAGVVAVVRLSEASELSRVADAIRAGGVDIIEFTLTTPGALEIIQQSARKFGDDVLLGAGTVLDAETARAAILAGAQFVVSPTTDFGTIELCHRYGKAVIPGAFTPTEILAAWQAGADFVKVFPAGVLGPGFLRDVLGPLPQVKLVPTGGVGKANAGDFIKAGAAALAVGGDLVNNKLVASGAFDQLTANARDLIAAVRSARGQ